MFCKSCTFLFKWEAIKPKITILSKIKKRLEFRNPFSKSNLWSYDIYQIQRTCPIHYRIKNDFQFVKEEIHPKLPLHDYELYLRTTKKAPWENVLSTILLLHFLKIASFFLHSSLASFTHRGWQNSYYEVRFYFSESLAFLENNSTLQF